MNKNGAWLSIIEYATLKGLSISTVRRAIKSRRVTFKKEKRKFFIFSDLFPKDKNPIEMQAQIQMQKLKVENEFLREKLRKFEEENNDLKMLVQLYESEGQALFEVFSCILEASGSGGLEIVPLRLPV